MDLDDKLAILAPAARFDACDRFLGKRRATPRTALWDDHAVAVDAERGACAAGLPPVAEQSLRMELCLLSAALRERHTTRGANAQ